MKRLGCTAVLANVRLLCRDSAGMHGHIPSRVLYDQPRSCACDSIHPWETWRLTEKRSDSLISVGCLRRLSRMAERAQASEACWKTARASRMRTSCTRRWRSCSWSWSAWTSASVRAQPSCRAAVPFAPCAGTAADGHAAPKQARGQAPGAATRGAYQQFCRKTRHTCGEVRALVCACLRCDLPVSFDLRAMGSGCRQLYAIALSQDHARWRVSSAAHRDGLGVVVGYHVVVCH